MGTWLAVFDNDGDVTAAISKRPDTHPLTGLLAENEEGIFADCDSVAIELDLEKETVKQVLRSAKKYGKRVYAVISNMSIAMERRDFLQQIDCFVCNQQEAGMLFSDDYDHLAPAGHWPDLRQGPGGFLRNWQPVGGVGHLHRRKRLPPLPPAGVRAGRGSGGLRKEGRPF